MAFQKRSYIGGGKLHVDGRFIGNCPALTVGFESEVLELPDYTSPGGGLYDSVDRISSVQFGFTFNDYNGDNLSMMLYGSSAKVPVETVSDEPISSLATVDRLVRTQKVIDISDAANTVTVTSDPAGTTYTLNVDYVVSGAGITPIEGGAIPASTPLLVSYTSIEVDLVQALVNSGLEYHMIFDGFNDAQSGLPVVVDIFKGKPGPADTLPFISEEFAEAEVTGRIVKDTSKLGADISQYFTVELA